MAKPANGGGSPDSPSIFQHCSRLLLYEDNHGLRETPHTVDFAINTILWFLETIDYKFQQ